MGHQVYELRWHDQVNVVATGGGPTESFRHVICVNGEAKLFNPDTGEIGKNLGTFSIAVPAVSIA